MPKKPKTFNITATLDGASVDREGEWIIKLRAPAFEGEVVAALAQKTHTCFIVVFAEDPSSGLTA